MNWPGILFPLRQVANGVSRAIRNLSGYAWYRPCRALTTHRCLFGASGSSFLWERVAPWFSQSVFDPDINRDARLRPPPHAHLTPSRSGSMSDM